MECIGHFGSYTRDLRSEAWDSDSLITPHLNCFPWNWSKEHFFFFCIWLPCWKHTSLWSHTILIMCGRLPISPLISLTSFNQDGCLQSLSSLAFYFCPFRIPRKSSDFTNKKTKSLYKHQWFFFFLIASKREFALWEGRHQQRIILLTTPWLQNHSRTGRDIFIWTN